MLLETHLSLICEVSFQLLPKVAVRSQILAAADGCGPRSQIPAAPDACGLLPPIPTAPEGRGLLSASTSLIHGLATPDACGSRGANDLRATLSGARSSMIAVEG